MRWPKLLDLVDDGEKLTEKQKLYHKQTRVRDLALLSLLLGTGIRVSECVGLNLDDIDLEACGARVYRKGGKEAIVYFSDEVRDTLELTYKNGRKRKRSPDMRRHCFYPCRKRGSASAA